MGKHFKQEPKAGLFDRAVDAAARGVTAFGDRMQAACDEQEAKEARSSP